MTTPADPGAPEPAAPETGAPDPDAPAGQHVVAVVSGGLDSVTMAHELASSRSRLTLVTVDYGQRHRRELDCARAAADRLGACFHLVDLRSVGMLLTGSSLTDPSVEVPDGHYTDDSMRSTVVPNRNALLLDVATAVAVAARADAVAIATHAGDHPVYPDCRPAFIAAYERLARVANEGFVDPGFRVLAPFLHHDKVDIVRAGDALGVPVAETWSCYRGEGVHCGRCGTCVERREAFQLAGVADPTTYEGG